MKIENGTGLDTSEIKRRFEEVAFGIKIKRLRVKLKDGNKGYITGHVQPRPGRYRNKDGTFTKGICQHMLLKVPKVKAIRQHFKTERGQPYKYVELTRLDALTFVFAHEMFHIIQYNERRRYSQYEADAFAYSIGVRLGIIKEGK